MGLAYSDHVQTIDGGKTRTHDVTWTIYGLALPSSRCIFEFEVSILLFTMRSSILLIGLLSTITGAQVNQCAGNKNTLGYCDTITFADQTTTSPRPPTTAECQDTCRGILSDAGDWIVDFRGRMISSTHGRTFRPHPIGT